VQDGSQRPSKDLKLLLAPDEGPAGAHLCPRFSIVGGYASGSASLDRTPKPTAVDLEIIALKEVVAQIDVDEIACHSSPLAGLPPDTVDPVSIS
jgi:uncharacterized protein YjlB